MPRIRTVKPDFWTDKKIRSIPRDARLLFIGLFNLADDEGRYLADPEVIKGQLFVSDADLLPEGVGRLLVVLHEYSLIRLYAVNDEDYLEICNFNKHQKINKPSPSRYPAFDEASGSVPGILREASVGEVEEDKDKEVDKEEEEEKDLKDSCVVNSEKPNEPDEPDKPDKPKYPPEFLALKVAYPERKGGNPWPKALRAVQVRLKEGETWEELLAATEAYAREMQAAKKEGTEFVLMAATFYGKDYTERREELRALPDPNRKKKLMSHEELSAVLRQQNKRYGVGGEG